MTQGAYTMADAVQSDFRAALVRHFAYLFNDYGFQFTASLNERGGEYQMQIATSPDCQIKFTLEQDAFSLYFARTDAPRVWPDEAGGVTWWHAVAMLMVFEDRLHPNQAVSLPPGRGDIPLDGVLQAYATLLRAYVDRMIKAFSPTPPPGWWAAYDIFISSV